VVAPALEGQYQAAAERSPFRPALVAAARGHLGVLQQRQTMLSEAGTEVEAAVARYEQAFERLRVGVLDAQAVRGEAEVRLKTLRRIEAEVAVGDTDNERAFISNAVAMTTELGLVDAKTGSPLVVADSGK
jgi:hypothetical protein